MKDLSDIDTQRKRDFDDLQHEISGVDNGRMKRFLNATDERTPEGRRKKREQESMRQRLADLLLDPVYARMHHQLGTTLSRAETKADSALANLQRQLVEVNQAIADMEDRAARDPNGKPVFRYADGRVFYADGSEVPDEIAEGIVWPADAPSAEDYFVLHTHLDQIEELIMEWDSYRNEVLGPIRDRYEDEDNPFQNPGALKDALDDIEQHRPSSVSIETSAPEEAVLSKKPIAFPDFN